MDRVHLLLVVPVENTNGTIYSIMEYVLYCLQSIYDSCSLRGYQLEAVYLDV